MTRKHFRLIAETIKDLRIDDGAREEVARDFAVALRQTNPNFDRERFLSACRRDA